jgi:amino acid permease
MNGSLYYFVTISLFIVEIALACALDDITTQFAFNAAIAATFICFWFPGGYYLLACGESVNKSTAYLLMICGLINFVLGMYTAIKTMER